jgi:hypothetical protein
VNHSLANTEGCLADRGGAAQTLRRAPARPAATPPGRGAGGAGHRRRAPATTPLTLDDADDVDDNRGQAAEDATHVAEDLVQGHQGVTLAPTAIPAIGRLSRSTATATGRRSSTTAGTGTTTTATAATLTAGDDPEDCFVGNDSPPNYVVVKGTFIAPVPGLVW